MTKTNKIVAYEEGKKFPKGTIQIRVVNDNFNGSVDIKAYTNKGEEFDCAYIAQISTEGIEFYSGLDEDVGIKLGKNTNAAKRIK